MANSDKNILITPAKNTINSPEIEFTGSDNTPVSLIVDDDGSLVFSGTGGQLFAISNDLSDTIFSVNDISGVPSLECDDTGAVRIAPYANSAIAQVLVGRNAPVPGDTSILQVDGSVRVGGDGGYTLPSIDGNSGQVLVTNGSGTLSFADGGGSGGGGDTVSPADALFYAIVFG